MRTQILLPIFHDQRCLTPVLGSLWMIFACPLALLRSCIMLILPPGQQEICARRAILASINTCTASNSNSWQESRSHLHLLLFRGALMSRIPFGPLGRFPTEEHALILTMEPNVYYHKFDIVHPSRACIQAASGWN